MLLQVERVDLSKADDGYIIKIIIIVIIYSYFYIFFIIIVVNFVILMIISVFTPSKVR